MAKGDPVDCAEFVIRYAKPSSVDGDVLTHVAFERRPGPDDDGLSISRRGLFSEEPQEDLRLLRLVMHCHYSMKATGRLGELQVGDIVAASKEVRAALFVEEDPVDADEKCEANPAHALIKNLPFKGTETGELSAIAAGDILALRVTAIHAAI